MANQPVRVMLRAYGGVPFRYASKDEKERSMEKVGQVFRKWKSAGVKLIGGFNTFGTWSEADGGFMILDFRSLAACRRKGGLRQIYDKFHRSESDLRRFSGHNVRIWVPSRAKPDVSPDCGRAETKLVHTRS